MNLLKTASRNESTKRIFWKLRHETHPQNESFERRRTKRIHETNLLNIVGIRKSRSQDSCSIEVRLCSKYSWGFVRICEDLWKKAKSCQKESTNWIHETDLLNTVVRNESTNWIFEHSRWIRETNPNWLEQIRIRETNPRFYKSFIQFPHP